MCLCVIRNEITVVGMLLGEEVGQGEEVNKALGQKRQHAFHL